MNAHYQRLASIRSQLSEVGYEDLADDLLQAERGATTSGEALDLTSQVLRKILDRGIPWDRALAEDVQAAHDEGRRLWHDVDNAPRPEPQANIHASWPG
jgi:hypothetical protein